MASIIRIKRSTVSGNPSTLAAGELAYSGLQDNGSNGGDRLYIGLGTETAGNAANHIVIGGKFFTDMLDHTKGVLTANSALVVDGNSKLDNLKVDNLDLNGNTLSSTNTNGDILITPNGTGKTIITNIYTDASTSLTEFIQDIAGGQTVGGVGLTATYDDAAGTTTIDLDNTAVTPGSYGSASAIPTFTVDQQGRLTAAGSVSVATILNIAGDSGTDGVSLLTDTLTFTGSTGLTSSVTNNQVTFTLDNTSVTAGSYGSSTAIPTFTVDAQGRLTAAGTATISTTLSVAADTGTGNGVSLLTDTLTVSGGTGIDTSISGDTITVAIDSTVATLTGTQTLTNKTLTSPVISTIVNTGTLTLPTSTDTLVGRATTDTLTNKTISGSSNTLTNIPNSALTNSSVTIGSTTISLGGTSTTLAGITQLDVDNIRIDGNEISSTNTNGDISLNPNGTGNIAVNSSRITGLSDPVDPQDAATKAYVDAARSGLDVKQSVRAASTGNLTLSGVQTVDGVSLVVGDRVLAKNQATASQNGVYVVASGAWSRATDFDEPYEVTAGVFFFVEEGTVNADAGFVITSDNPQTVGTDPLTFTQFSGAGQIVAGDGLSKSGNTLTVNTANGIEISADNVQLASSVAGSGLTYSSGVLSIGGTSNRITVNADSIDIASTYVGQTSITTLGTVTTGTWQANVINASYIAQDLTISGGTINNTPIGATTRSSGAFTTLSANGATSLTSTLSVSGATTLSSTLGVSGNVTLAANLTGSGSSVLSGFDIDGGTY